MNINLYEELKKFQELNNKDNVDKTISKKKQEYEENINKSIKKRKEKEQEINNKKIVDYSVKGGLAMMFLPFIMNNKNKEK